jgi:hypothetical protein
MERTKAVATVAGIVVIICSIWVLSLNKNRIIEHALAHQKLKTERLLAEKLQAEKGVDKGIARIRLLETEKADLQNRIKEKNNEISTNLEESERIRQENTKVKKQIALANDSARNLAELNRRTAELCTSMNFQLKKLQDSLDFFHDENLYLQRQFAMSILQSIDQTLVTPLKKDHRRITAKARSTRKIVATVSVPLKLENMTFSVDGPSGAALSDEDVITSRVVPAPGSNVTASHTDFEYKPFQTKTVEMIYEPKGKLNGGVYKIKIFSSGAYVGSMKVKLK